MAEQVKGRASVAVPIEMGKHVRENAMGQRMRLKSAIVLGLLTCWVSAARADTTYSYFYRAGQATYNGITPGGTLNVPLYLEEVNSDASSNSLLFNEDGLSGAGIAASFFSTSGGSNTTITGITANSGSPPAGFDTILDQSSTSTTAALLENLNFIDADGVAAGPQSNGVSELFLGTLSLLVSSTPGQTTTFTLGAYDPGNGNTVTFTSGYDLDNNADPFNPAGASDLYFSAAPTNFSVTTEEALPEPASISLLAISMLTLSTRSARTRIA